MDKKQHRLVCDMEGSWTLQQRVERDDHTTDWIVVKTFIAKHRQGYEAAKQWMEENL